MKFKMQNLLWGLLLLFAAAALIINHLGVWVRFEFWTIVYIIAAISFLGNAISNRSLSTLPFFVGATYLVLASFDLVPYLAFWIVLLSSGLASAGIGLLFPQKIPKKGRIAVGSFCCFDDDDDEGGYSEAERDTAERNAEDNPRVNAIFGGASRYLQARNLESVRLSVAFGGIDVYLEQARLAPGGAIVQLDCKFGGIDLYVPKHWNVVEDVACVFGAIDIAERLAPLEANAPTLTIRGNVTFGGVDVTYV